MNDNESPSSWFRNSASFRGLGLKGFVTKIQLFLLVMASRPCFFFPHRAVYKAGLKEPTAFAAKNTTRLVGIVWFEVANMWWLSALYKNEVCIQNVCICESASKGCDLMPWNVTAAAFRTARSVLPLRCPCPGESTHLVMLRLDFSAMTPPSTFQISLQTWFTNSLAWEMTLGGQGQVLPQTTEGLSI